MRRLIPVVLCSIAFASLAAEPIDLDKPGALAALERDNPTHYEAVMKRVEEVQKIELPLGEIRNLGMFLKPDPRETSSYGILKPSYPAQMRITVVVETQPYEITVRYTKDPGSLINAR